MPLEAPHLRRGWATLPVTLAFFLLVPPALSADWKDEIGFNRLHQRLGPSLTTGGSIQATQVEMPVDTRGDYLPDRSDVQLAGKVISGLSGTSGISDHATIVGQYYCGLTSSIGPGIRLVATYEANDWSGRGCLNLNSPFEPEAQTRLVQNHSWVGTFGRPALDSDCLRRMDLAIERDGLVVAAGVKNGSTTAMPELMCSAYNIIAVGLTNGRSSRGPTRVESAGRVKPDLVAPLTATSWATPVVASSASLLLESITAADALAKVPAAERATARQLLTKGLLMGGATKDEWPDWRRGFATPCTDGSVPLDYRYGAGELNIDNSYRILAAGRRAPGNVPATGWAYDQAVAGQPARYFFEVPTSRVGRTVSILATWNRHIHVTPGQPLVLTPSLANIDLRLYKAVGRVPAALVDASVSRVDNVEHIFQRDLPSGSYMIEVSSDQAWEYCLTWDAQVEPAPAVIVDRAAAPKKGAKAAPAVAAASVITAARPAPTGNVPVPTVKPVAAPADDDDIIIKQATASAQPLMP